jgi:23S rRNA (cytosine1962-C5)-methyltransferase
VGGMVVEALQQAWTLREPFVAQLRAQGTDTYRFLNGDGDGIPGLVIEVFASVGIFQFHQGKCELTLADLKIAARWCVDHLGVKQVYLKRFVPDRTSGEAPDDLLSPIPFVGEPAEPTVTARENGHAFLIRPYVGFSVGLFLDQRDNRRHLASRLEKNSQVLNLFSYTCGFSVYAAMAGATVTSVDVSTKVLEWGKENFRANGLPDLPHRFFAADARYFLKAAIKRQEQYDQIILDPPSFARGKKNEPFSVRRNLGEVLESCARVLNPGGTLFVSTNFSQWDGDDLEAEIEKVLGPVRYLEVPALPKDFKKGSVPITYRWVQR